MEIKIEMINEVPVAKLISEEVEIKNSQDALEIMMNGYYQGADYLLIDKKNLIPAFFELKSGIAGEILQKFSTYNTKLIILGDFHDLTSKSLRDFIRESNKADRINFISSLSKVKEILSK